MLRIAHRGASGYELENSMKAFKKAIAIGVHFVEVDVHITKDKKFVAYHDYNLSRCANSDKQINELTRSEIDKYVRLSNGETIPHIEEVCELFCEHGITGIFDLKDDDIAVELYHVIREYMNPDKIIIGSFFHRQIREVKIMHPEALTCIMMEAYPVGLATYLEEMKVDYAAMGFPSICQELIDEIQKAEVKVLIWTLNEVRDIEKIKNFSVDGIISNFPARI